VAGFIDLQQPGNTPGSFLCHDGTTTLIRALRDHDEWVAEMNTKLERRERDRLVLPASSWWIPSMTAVGVVLAVLVALA
jgi:hypothetical protein